MWALARLRTVKVGREDRRDYVWEGERGGVRGCILGRGTLELKLGHEGVQERLVLLTDDTCGGTDVNPVNLLLVQMKAVGVPFVSHNCMFQRFLLTV